MKGVIRVLQRTSDGAEKPFRVNPSSLINSGAVVRRIRAAKLSESELSQRDVVRSHRMVRSSEKSKISRSNTIRYVRKK